jgi:hypothetical protein
VREVTVRSFSMAMGIRRPGFQLLSLAPLPPENSNNLPTDTPCHLPDQIGIYLSVYIPLIIISVFVLLFSNFLRARRHNYSLVAPREPLTHSRRHSDIWTSASPVFTHFARPRAEGKDIHRSSSEDEGPASPTTAAQSFLPMPSDPRRSGRTVIGVRQFIDALALRTSYSRRKRKGRSLLNGFTVDFMNVALFPLLLWMFITWRAFSGS